MADGERERALGGWRLAVQRTIWQGH
jgi:hypothetical protein